MRIGDEGNRDKPGWLRQTIFGGCAKCSGVRGF
jgi:hypothetical protein